VVRSRPAGTVFDLTVERGGRTMTVRVPSADLPSVAEGVGLGIAGDTRGLKIDLPFEVSFADRPEVGGPSAGLVHALAIADLLDQADHAGGQTVAATGTIDVDGNVGPVGGVPEKAITVKDAGADLFLVPQDEVDEARHVEDLPVRGVERLEEALRVLSGQPEAA
jgi:PDZ domain-containing protein